MSRTQALRAAQILALIVSGIVAALGLVSSDGAPLAGAQSPAFICASVLLTGMANWRD